MGYKLRSVLGWQNNNKKNKELSFFTSKNELLLKKMVGSQFSRIERNQDNLCFTILLQQKNRQLLLLKKREVYCLLHPRKEIIKIATECEKTLKSLTKKDFIIL